MGTLVPFFVRAPIGGTLLFPNHGPGLQSWEALWVGKNLLYLCIMKRVVQHSALQLAILYLLLLGGVQGMASGAERPVGEQHAYVVSNGVAVPQEIGRASCRERV